MLFGLDHIADDSTNHFMHNKLYTDLHPCNCKSFKRRRRRLQTLQSQNEELSTQQETLHICTAPLHLMHFSLVACPVARAIFMWQHESGCVGSDFHQLKNLAL